MTTSLRSVGIALTLAASTCSTTGGEEPAATATTTSAPATTAAPTSTAGTTTATTTTTIPSPAAGELVITIELTPEEQAVVDALYAGRMLAFEAVMDPDAPGLDQRLDARFADGGQQRRSVDANREYARQEGLRARLSPDGPWQLIIEDVEFFEPSGEIDYSGAIVTTCVVDNTILFEPGGAPDGSDVIVNDDIGAQRAAYTLIIADGTWHLLWGEDLTEMQIGASACPAAEQ